MKETIHFHDYAGRITEALGKGGILLNTQADGRFNTTLEEGRTIATPGVREYPITLECRVLYANLQDIGKLPEDIREQMYPQDKDSSEPMANRDAHIEYVGEIVDAYIIR